jgi:hypothetical protein
VHHWQNVNNATGAPDGNFATIAGNGDPWYKSGTLVLHAFDFDFDPGLFWGPREGFIEIAMSQTPIDPPVNFAVFLLMEVRRLSWTPVDVDHNYQLVSVPQGPARTYRLPIFQNHLLMNPDETNEDGDNPLIVALTATGINGTFLNPLGQTDPWVYDPPGPYVPINIDAVRLTLCAHAALPDPTS